MVRMSRTLRDPLVGRNLIRVLIRFSSATAARNNMTFRATELRPTTAAG
jgi:hypothetical protein